MNWDLVNSIDWDLIWQGVSEHDPAPGDTHRQLIKEAQIGKSYRDPLSRWVADEDSEGWPDACTADGTRLRNVDPGPDLPCTGSFRRSV